MCKNILYKVFVNTFFFSENGVFLANCENIRWNRVIAEIFRVSLNTHTNCRYVMNPGMHGCRTDKVTQIQSQICDVHENAQFS